MTSVHVALASVRAGPCTVEARAPPLMASNPAPNATIAVAMLREMFVFITQAPFGLIRVSLRALRRLRYGAACERISRKLEREYGERCNRCSMTAISRDFVRSAQQGRSRASPAPGAPPQGKARA